MTEKINGNISENDIIELAEKLNLNIKLLKNNNIIKEEGYSISVLDTDLSKYMTKNELEQIKRKLRL